MLHILGISISVFERWKGLKTVFFCGGGGGGVNLWVGSDRPTDETEEGRVH